MSELLTRVRQRVGSERYRVFQLFYVEGMSATHVAALMGLAVSRVYTITYRVLDLLGREIRKLQAAEPHL